MTPVVMRVPGRLLLPLVFTGASLLVGADGYFVEGVVVDSQSHAPIAHARVALAPTKTRTQKTEFVTKQDGRFSFPVSQPGKYSLTVSKSGYPPQAYKQVELAAVSTAIVVREDQDTSHIVFEARRGSAIAGQIRDEDAEPVGYALVGVFQSTVVAGEKMVIPRGQARANAAGEFRFGNLSRGSYYVCAMGRPWFADSLIELQAMDERPPFSRRRTAQPAVQADQIHEQPAPAEERMPPYSPDPGFRGTAFLTTCYPNAQAVEAAAPVRLGVGDEAQVSITLPLTRAVSVKGRMILPGDLSKGRVVLNKKIYDRYMPFLDGETDGDGTFQFDNVPAGTYEIVAESHSSGASGWTIRQEVEVGASDMEVQLRAAQMGSFSGRVFFDGESPSSTVDLSVLLRDEKGMFREGKVGPEGNFSLDRLPVGRYDVLGGSGDYSAAYLKGPAGEQLPLSVEIGSGATVRQDVAFIRHLAAIEGTVERAGVLQIGALVLLVPKNQSQRWRYRVDQTDSDGSYSLARIPTGDYFLIGLSEGENVVYRDAKVAAILTRAGKPIHVEAGAHLDLKVDVVDVRVLNLPSL